VPLAHERGQTEESQYYEEQEGYLYGSGIADLRKKLNFFMLL